MYHWSTYSKYMVWWSMASFDCHTSKEQCILKTINTVACKKAKIGFPVFPIVWHCFHLFCFPIDVTESYFVFTFLGSELLNQWLTSSFNVMPCTPTLAKSLLIFMACWYDPLIFQSYYINFSYFYITLIITILLHIILSTSLWVGVIVHIFIRE